MSRVVKSSASQAIKIGPSRRGVPLPRFIPPQLSLRVESLPRDLNGCPKSNCLEPLARGKSPLSVLPPRKTRFGSPLVLSRVHWAEPKLVAEITWAADNLLRHTAFVGLHEDKPAEQVRREAS